MAALGLDAALLSDPRDGTGGEIEGGVPRAGEDDDFEDFARDLRKRGMSKDQVQEAISSAKDYLRGHSSGRDHARDRPPSRGGYFEKPRFGRDRGDEEVGRIHDLLKRFEPGEAGYAPDRNRHAYDAAPQMSERQKERFAKRFPDIAANMARIGNMMDGTPPEAADRRNPYEV